MSITEFEKAADSSEVKSFDSYLEDLKKVYFNAGAMSERIVLSSKKPSALCLRAEGNYVILEIENQGLWIELLKEQIDTPFSSIIEPIYISNKIKKEENCAMLNQLKK